MRGDEGRSGTLEGEQKESLGRNVDGAGHQGKKNSESKEEWWGQNGRGMAIRPLAAKVAK